MDYERASEKHARYARLEFGKRFLIHTDIANFFPSIYSHAFPWGAVGFATAKAKKGRRYAGEWFNQLDERLRWNKRGETQGVAIGPATSNIIAESILARVDAILTGEDFEFIRYIDDYTAYCKSEDNAQEFIRRLSEELAKYKLLLSIKKTEVRPLPHARNENWITELRLALPASKEISEFDAISYLDLAAGLSKSSPDGSALKYALVALLNKSLKPGTEARIIPKVLALAFHQPALLPALSTLFDRARTQGRFGFSAELRAIATENARYRRSDGLCWALYELIRNGGRITTQLASKIIATEDCCSILLLYAAGPAFEADVVKFARGLNAADYYELDQYWLLLYELFAAGKIPNPYAGEEAFPCLKKENVSFLDRTSLIPPRPRRKRTPRP